MEMEIKQIGKYLLMDHSIQKCILHVIVEQKTTFMSENKSVFLLAYATDSGQSRWHRHAGNFFPKALDNYISKLAAVLSSDE